MAKKKEVFATGDWEGFERELIAFLSLGGSSVSTGVPKKVHDSRRSRNSSPPMTVEGIVKINEFGHDGLGIAARPIFGPAMDANSDDYYTELRHITKRAMKRGGGRATLKAGLRDLGGRMVEDVHTQQKLQDFEPLRPSTITRKGHDEAWLETGDVLESIQATVELEGGFETFKNDVSAFRGAKGRFVKAIG